MLLDLNALVVLSTKRIDFLNTDHEKPL
jgi:hypothetical protein